MDVVIIALPDSFIALFIASCTLLPSILASLYLLTIWMLSSTAIPIVIAPTIKEPRFKSLPITVAIPPANKIGMTLGIIAIAPNLIDLNNIKTYLPNEILIKSPRIIFPRIEK